MGSAANADGPRSAFRALSVPSHVSTPKARPSTNYKRIRLLGHILSGYRSCCLGWQGHSGHRRSLRANRRDTWSQAGVDSRKLNALEMRIRCHDVFVRGAYGYLLRPSAINGDCPAIEAPADYGKPTNLVVHFALAIILSNSMMRSSFSVITSICSLAMAL